MQKPIDPKLTNQVKLFLESGDRTFLDTLMAMDRNELGGQATVRYLMQLKHWPFTPESGFSDTLNHLFAEYPERTKMDSASYQELTFELIKRAYDYECVVVVPEPRPEPKLNPGKVTRRPKMVSEAEDTKSDDEGETGSKTFKSINESNA